MNLDTLRPILQGYREQVAPAWSPATAYNGEGKQGDPTGQCGVTSAWLQRRLTEDHGVETVYRIGSAWRLGDDEQLRDHCWLEIGEGWERVIIDLTAGQMEGLPGDAVFCETFQTLCSYEISYVADRRLDAAELAADSVQPRLAVLEAALS